MVQKYRILRGSKHALAVCFRLNMEEEKVESSEASSPNPALTPDNGGRKSKK